MVTRSVKTGYDNPKASDKFLFERIQKKMKSVSMDTIEKRPFAGFISADRCTVLVFFLSICCQEKKNQISNAKKKFD